jgi:hypothetical protein
MQSAFISFSTPVYPGAPDPGLKRRIARRPGAATTRARVVSHDLRPGAVAQRDSGMGGVGVDQGHRDLCPRDQSLYGRPSPTRLQAGAAGVRRSRPILSGFAVSIGDSQ